MGAKPDPLRVVGWESADGVLVFDREKKCSPPNPGLDGGAAQSGTGIPPPAKQTASPITNDRRTMLFMVETCESEEPPRLAKVIRKWSVARHRPLRGGRIGQIGSVT